MDHINKLAFWDAELIDTWSEMHFVTLNDKGNEQRAYVFL